MTTGLDFIDEELKDVRSAGLYRELKTSGHASSHKIEINGKRLINFSSNNYLGLATHKEVISAGVETIKKYGSGSGASRLLGGNLKITEELEEEISALKGTEASLVFPSGYSANLGVISALIGKDDVVFIDEYDHASIIDACRLSRATMKIYSHCDAGTLEKALKRYVKFKKRLIVTDGVFSMDGNIAPLKEIWELSKKYGTILMVDDAHGTGVFGKDGAGVLSHFGIHDSDIIQMGTLSKALAGSGGFISGRKIMREYLVNKSRQFIYTTGISPVSAGSARKTLEIIRENPELRKKLLDNADYFRENLKSMGFDVLNSETQIVPLVVGDSGKAVSFAKKLFDNGIFCPAIRFPTVPKGRERLRFSIMATHTKEELDFTLQAIKKHGKSILSINL